MWYSLIRSSCTHVDPDYPSPKNRSLGEWQHWLVGNIPGNDVKKGEVLSEYVGPVPHKDTGKN